MSTQKRFLGFTVSSPYYHYGPLDDFHRRLQLIADSPVDGVWIQRYSYLSDAKLDAIGEIWR